MDLDFQALLAAEGPDPICYLDRELRHLWTNHPYELLVGRTWSELRGAEPSELLFGGVRSEMQAALRGEALDFELPFPGATPSWWRVRYQPDWEDGGAPRGFFAIFTNITAQKAAEKELARVRLWVDSLPHLVARIDGKLRYRYVNASCALVLGERPDQILGKTVEQLSPGLFSQIRPKAERLLAGHAVSFDVELTMPDGRQIWHNIEASPEQQTDGEISFFVILSDIAKRRELERLRGQMAAARVRAQEDQRATLARELHDGLGQELASLAVLSDALIHSKDPTTTAETAAIINGGLRHVVAEVRRISYGLHPLALEETGLFGAVQEFIERSRSAHPQVRIEVDVKGFDRERPLAPDWQLSAFRIVQEAVGNALRHGRPSEVRVALELGGSLLLGEISDDGRGFDPREVDAGLGLASMRERATLMGGGAHIESGAGGTQISFFFQAEDPSLA